MPSGKDISLTPGSFGSHENPDGLSDDECSSICPAKMLLMEKPVLQHFLRES